MDKQATRAKEIIHKLLYITIATASKDGAPWNTPVYAAFDEEYNFYWCSDSQAQHSRNIAGNEDVFIVIYDSTVSAGKGQGVYMQAKAEQVTSNFEIIKAHSLLTARGKGYPWTVEELRGEGRPTVYKAVPQKVWMNRDGEADGSYIDVRVEINLLSN
jgi:uncharacterized pyridoxamine 5'-phosphate oxidase family protein